MQPPAEDEQYRLNSTVREGKTYSFVRNFGSKTYYRVISLGAEKQLEVIEIHGPEKREFCACLMKIEREYYSSEYTNPGPIEFIKKWCKEIPNEEYEKIKKECIEKLNSSKPI